ncbi:MAG: AAA family ATPase, partial [Myxococcaceae bacterium]|nr:AAA family ATPase [Myxococcaceae bacterium]
METRTFPVFVRKFPGVGYSAHLLDAPHLASFGETMSAVYADLTEVCRKLLDRGELRALPALGPFTLRRVDLTIRAMQRGRLLPVPMRFSVLVSSDEKGPARVLVPRLELEHTLAELADFDGFIEEVIRHELHLAPLERLLEVAWDGEESVRSLTVTTKFDERASARREQVKEAQQDKRRQPLPPGLSEACRRLNDEAGAGLLERAFERDAEAALLEEALLGSGKGSVLLVGPSLVGKTALVHEVVHRSAEVPKQHPLHGLEVYSTSGSRIVAGMRYLGEWQDRVRRMVASLRTRNAVLHFDSLGELLSAGTGRGDSGLDLAQQLLASVETNEVRLVVEATPEDVARAERTHGAFVRALRAIAVRPLGSAQAKKALAAAARRLGKVRRVELAPAALDRAIDLVERFGEAGGVPGAA